MGSWNITDIENGIRFLFFFLLFFLFNFLFIGNPVISLQIRQIHEADVGIFPILIHIVQHIHHLGVIQHSLIIILAHCIHRPVHTIITDTDIIRKMVHLSRLAFRAPADKAHILIFFFIVFFPGGILILRRSLHFFQALFLFILIFSIFKIAHRAILHFPVQSCRLRHKSAAGSCGRLYDTHLIINHNLLPYKLSFYKQKKQYNTGERDQ